jgi:hypothetical protein
MSQVRILSTRPLISKGFSPASYLYSRSGSQAISGWVTDWGTTSGWKTLYRNPQELKTVGTQLFPERTTGPRPGKTQVRFSPTRRRDLRRQGVIASPLRFPV